MMNTSMLEVCNLTIGFSSEGRLIKAVDNVSFTMDQAETLAIVGESGSGKTLSALAILKLIPTTPDITMNGSVFFKPDQKSPTDILKLDEKTLSCIRGNEISMIFQEPMTSLNPVFSCGDQAAEPLVRHKGCSKKEARDRVLELFNEVLLQRPEAVFRSFPHQLSGGQKQRVMIAMALACDPKILIADEPTTALDVTVQKTILGLIRKIQKKRNTGILFITHDLSLAAGFADQVAVMHKGRIIEKGPISIVFNNPLRPYTRGLLACRPPLDYRPEKLPTVDTFLKCEKIDKTNRISKQDRLTDHLKIYNRKPVLEIQTIGKKFSSRNGLLNKKKTNIALEGVSFFVYPGETLGIVGESGSGKTTMARVILALIPPTTGKIFFQGNDITNLSSGKLKKFRKSIQIIFQDPYSSLNPRISVGETILEPMKIHGLITNNKSGKERVVSLLEQVGMNKDHYERYPHELSGGQRQRICIARALAIEPALIICDEAVSALDVSVQAQVLNLLNDLKKQFTLTYIFISHDLSVVKYMSDRIIVLKNGKIVESGEADRIYEHPETEYTRELLTAIPGRIQEY